MDDTSRRVGDYDSGPGRSSDDPATGRPSSPDDARARSADADLMGRAADADLTGRRADLDVTTREAGTEETTDRRTTEIRQEIEQTRDEMSETIDAIQEKLRPANIVANATERVKTAATEKVHEATERVREMADTAGERAQDVIYQTRERAGGLAETIRQHPIPAALIGAGAAWLLAKRSRSDETYWRDESSRARDYRAPEYATASSGRTAYAAEYRYDEGRRSGVMGRLRSNPVPAVLAGVGLSWLAFSAGDERNRGRGIRYGRSDEYARSRAYAGRLSEGASSATGTSNEESRGEGTGGNVSESAEQIASRAKDYAEETTRAIRERSRRARNQLQRMIEDNPLLVGAGALMLGAAFGLAVPETDIENEWLGDTRDTVVERAQDVTRNASSQAVQDAAASLIGTGTKKQE